MVSTNHKNAEYYFDRDVQGVVDFFKRKFEFTSVEPVPKLSDVERRHNMDIELAASGYNKKIEEEMEQMEAEFRPVIQNDEGEEDENEDERDPKPEVPGL